MTGRAVWNDNKHLIVLLTFLTIIITELIIGIIIINTSQNRTVIASEEQIEAEKYANNVMDYYALRDTVSDMLNNGTATAENIIDLYNKAIHAENSEGMELNMYLLAEYEDLLRGGFRKEALAEFSSIDYSFLGETEQHMWYSQIVALANEFDDTEILQKYEPLLKATEDTYKASYEASEEAARKYEALTE